MINCNKCGNYFKKSAIIDGKRKNLQGRKFCLDCSPFGKHQSRILQNKKTNNLSLETIPLVCTICARKYDYHHAIPKGHTKTKCNSCLVNARRFMMKIKAVEYKGGKCERCSYSKCVRALGFHHKNPNEKDFQISNSHCFSWERIKLELDKCEILCSNCHAEIHNELESEHRKRIGGPTTS